MPRLSDNLNESKSNTDMVKFPAARIPAKPVAAQAKPAAPPPPPRSKYAAVSTAQVFKDGDYITPGDYIAMITRVEEGTTTNQEDFVSFHLAILAADDSVRTALDNRLGGPTKKPGSSTTDFRKTNKRAFAANMMAAAMVISNMTQDEITASEEYPGQFIEEIVGADQPFAGAFVQVRVGMRKNKDNKNVPDEQVDSKGCYPRVTYVRRVAASELPGFVDPAILARLVPNLDELIALEAENPVDTSVAAEGGEDE